MRIWRYSLLITLFVGVWEDVSAAGRVLVRKVHVDGAHRISEDRIRGWLVTRPGMPLDSLLIEKDMARILKGYLNEGYWQVAVAFPEGGAEPGACAVSD